MTANPIELIGGLADTGHVVKADIVAWAKEHVPQSLADATEVRGTVLAGQLVIYVRSLQQFFELDAEDTTTADDGVSCIHSGDDAPLRFNAVSSIVAPTLESLGGVFALDAVTDHFVTGLDTDGNLTHAQPSASNLSDGLTGTGKVVRETSPTLVTPTLGAAAATSINKVAITAPATGATLTIADGKTFEIANTIELTGTDGEAYAMPATGDTLLGRVSTDTLENKSIDADNNTVSNLETDNFKSGVIDTDGTLTANSDTKLATQKAVKTYVDQIIAAQDAMVFKGVIDCSANPNYPAADRGHTYRVSVAGKIGGASGVNVEVGDLLLCLTDSTLAGNQATVGTAWSIAQVNIDGAVVGPASAVNSNAAAFDGTSGKLIKDSGKAFPSGTIVGTSDTQTLTGKTVNLTSNTLTGTTAQFNTALSDGDFATLAGSETLSNKALTAPDINGGTVDALTSLGIRSTGSGAFDLKQRNTENLSADRTITWAVGNANRGFTFGGDISFGGAFTVSGAFGVTLTAAATTILTLPTTGTLATLAGSETFTNKTLTSPDIDGGTVDNVVVGGSTPAAGSFTSLTATQVVYWTGVISPTQITANTNDYAPTGFATANVLRLSTDASRQITGLAGGTTGRKIIIHNVGAADLVLVDDSGSSTAANRFAIGTDVTIPANRSATLHYDGTSSRWRMTASAGGSSGGGSGTVTNVSAGVGLQGGGTTSVTVEWHDDYRRNILLDRGYLSKALGTPQRRINEWATGFKAATDADRGINIGSSSNVDVSNAATGGYVGPNSTPSTDQTATHTGATASGNTASASSEHDSGSFPAWKAFDKVTGGTVAVGNWLTNSTTTGWLQYQFGSAKTIASYTIRSGNGLNARAPRDWTLLGSNTGAFGGEETTLDTRAGETGWSAGGEVRSFSISSPGSFAYYRLNVTANNGDGSFLQIDEVTLKDASVYEDATVTFVSSTTDGTITHVRMLIEFDNSASPDLNTDLTAEVSCNGGTDFEPATLSVVTSNSQSGRTVVETADTECSVSGSSFTGRIKILNNHNVHLHVGTLTAH